MNPRLEQLHPYPFQKLRELFAGVTPNPDLSPINLSIGEPKHPTPQFIKDALIAGLAGLSNYPITQGSDALRASDRRVGGAALRREARSGDRGAAGERLARSAVRLRPGQRRFQPPRPPRGHLAQSVLPDLRRRGAAGRRPPLLPQHPAGKRLQDGLVARCRKTCGSRSIWSTSARPATPPAR